MSTLSVHDIQGISAYQNKIRIPSGHQLSFDGNLKLPSWSNSTRPISPEIGLIGYNSDILAVEIYNGSEWVGIGGSSLGTEDRPASSAKELVDNGITENGVYYIQASAGAPVQQVYCILDPSYDGGGWMIIANNSASGVIYNSSHICRATAYSQYVGSTGANSYTPSLNFSINCTDMSFNKLVWVVMNSNTDNTFIGSGGGNVTGYIHFQWTNGITIPSNTQYWAVDQGTSGFTMGTQVSWPGFGNKRMNSDYGGYGGYSGQNYGFGNLHNSTYSTVTRGTTTNYKLSGGGGAYYPSTVTFQGSGANSGNTDAYYCWSFTDAYGTTAGAAQQAIGFDDWQDGSGLGDQWRVENTNDKSTTRGKPSFIMIKSV